MNVLEFHNYYVNRLQYTRNDHFKLQKSRISLHPNLKTHVEVNKNNIFLTLTITAGSLEESNEPFLVKCSLTGHFVYHPDKDKSKLGLDTFVRNNAIAILYPYARALISMLTNNSNEYPGYHMPTINVSDAIKQSNEKNNDQKK